MSLRSCSAVLAIAVGISTASGAQATQVANGLTSNGLTSNGLTSNGLTSNGVSANGQDARGRLHKASSGTVQIKAVILQDGSTVDLR